MGRPDYDDATADGDDGSTTQGDSTGWLQHGQDPGDIELRGS